MYVTQRSHGLMLNSEKLLNSFFGGRRRRTVDSVPLYNLHGKRIREEVFHGRHYDVSQWEEHRCSPDNTDSGSVQFKSASKRASLRNTRTLKLKQQNGIHVYRDMSTMCLMRMRPINRKHGRDTRSGYRNNNLFI